MKPHDWLRLNILVRQDVAPFLAELGDTRERVSARFLSSGALSSPPHICPQTNPQANLSPSDEKEGQEHRELRAFAGNVNRNGRAVRSETAQDIPRRVLAAGEEEVEGKAMESEQDHHRQLRAFAGNVNRNGRAFRSQTLRDFPRRALAAGEEEVEGKAMESEQDHHRQLRAFAGNVNRNGRAVRSETAQDVPRRALSAEEDQN